MTEKERFEIPIDEIVIKFQWHLEMENNNRILFSWKYGTWKTYFLNNFFNSKQEEYEVFHLYPINYQISQNEDIINFLKYDILIELINKNPNIFKKTKIINFLDWSILSYLFFNSKENIVKSLKIWVDFIPTLGRPINETIWFLEKFINFKQELESLEKWIIDDFLKEIKDKNITENDLISELVKNKINEVKWDKKSVLILDDLDRIDPEHIFRLLNIFWAHYDDKNHNLPNKFWFDKIILVCDYENIKSIFHHKYWKKADFNWYIDKFFSVKKYDFDNKFIIIRYLNEIIQNFKINNESIKNEIEKKEVFYFKLLKIFLNLSYSNNENNTNLRWLLKPTLYDISISNWYQNHNYNYVFDYIIKILINIYWWNKDTLVNLIKEIKNNIFDENVEENMFSREKFLWFFIYKMYTKISTNYHDEWNYKNYTFTLNSTYNIDWLDKEQLKELFFLLLEDYIKLWLYN